MLNRAILSIARGSLAAALGLTVAGCSSDAGGPSGSVPLTQAEAQAVGVEMQGEVVGLTTGASLLGFFSPNMVVLPEAARASRVALHFSPPAGCPTFSQFPPVDADGDHVPDDLTLTFDPATCTFTDRHGNSMTLSGVVTITDPSQVNPGLRVAFAAFEDKIGLADNSFFRRSVDGVWQLVSDASGFGATDSTTTEHESTQRGLATLAKAWQVNFVVDAGQTFVPDHPLPAGMFTITGSTTRTHDAESKSFTISTVAPLHFDPTCADDNRIVSGELHAVHTDTRGTATVDILFNGCGVQPTITLVTGPAST